ncbi:hypothetical protein K431DRAFT_71184 [Polychaeton citri CBS 116435]|uniref:Uncharacterized protein n=1 Tax=Polychaeton citri CBS 116435 TaxID=1314669 RepID=A0A9P4Q921_9PEZI|nr:hypothetical protein K431DRAFT_71184 [Polychaeton citri CBS 116435]
MLARHVRKSFSETRDEPSPSLTGQRQDTRKVSGSKRPALSPRTADTFSKQRLPPIQLHCLHLRSSEQRRFLGDSERRGCGRVDTVANEKIPHLYHNSTGTHVPFATCSSFWLWTGQTSLSRPFPESLSVESQVQLSPYGSHRLVRPQETAALRSSVASKQGTGSYFNIRSSARQYLQSRFRNHGVSCSS